MGKNKKIIQKILVEEFKQQGADYSIINWSTNWLTTKSQMLQMMDYLISIREEHIPKGEVIDMIDKIAEKNKIIYFFTKLFNKILFELETWYYSE